MSLGKTVNSMSELFFESVCALKGEHGLQAEKHLERSTGKESGYFILFQVIYLIYVSAVLFKLFRLSRLFANSMMMVMTTIRSIRNDWWSKV